MVSKPVGNVGAKAGEKMVDDVFCTGTGKLFEGKVVELRNTFPFGQWVCARDHPIKYCGSTVI